MRRQPSSNTARGKYTANCIPTRVRFFEQVNAIPGMKAYASQGNSMLLNCSGTSKLAVQYVDQQQAAGCLMRDQSNSRGLAGGDFFRVTLCTDEEMDSVASIIQNTAHN